MTATLLVATWRDGIHVIAEGGRRHELAGRPVAALAGDGHSGALAVVDGGALYSRRADGSWRPLLSTDLDLSCCMSAGNAVYAGTNDARVVRVGPDGTAELLAGFDLAEGRETWYAGTAVVGGEVVGPPLGVRSMAATADGSALLVNVHVGGIPRSTNGGATWRATIEIEADVHEVRAHPGRPNVVAAASAVGLCLSRDAGATWTIEQDGLHAPYCSAVTFVGDDVLVAASEHHFSRQGAIYRRALEGDAPLARLLGGVATWLDGIVDTHCIASRGSDVAVADKQGNVYTSADGGRAWSLSAEDIERPSALLLV